MSSKKKGVRFTSESIDEEHDEENPTKLKSFDFDKLCKQTTSPDNSIELYFGVLKLAHKYGMNALCHTTTQTENLILSQPTKNHVEVSVNLSKQDQTNANIHIELKIMPNAQPGSFAEQFTIENKQTKEKVSISVTGKILRKDQGTPLLHHGVHVVGTVAIDEND